MIRKTIVLVFLSFIYAKFSYAEITETELGDGTIVRRTTTRITNADNPFNSNGGNRQDETGNNLFRNGNGPVIYLTPSIDYAPHDGPHSPDHAPYPGHMPNNGYVPDIGSDR